MDSMKALLALGLAVGLSAAAGPVHAGSKYQTTLVPNQAGTNPGFSASGSSIKFDGHRMLKGKLKNVVDGTGNRVNTTTPYSVEMDVAVGASSGTLTVSVNLTNGNGTFAADESSATVFTGAMTGAGVAVNGVRVKDSTGTVIGSGGVAIE